MPDATGREPKPNILKTDPPAAVLALARTARARLTLARGLSALAWTLPISLVLAAGTVAVLRGLAHEAVPGAAWLTASALGIGVLAGVGMLGGVVGAAAAALWRAPTLTGAANFLDRRLGLHDQLASAMLLTGPSTSGSFTDLARRQAEAAAQQIELRRAVGLLDAEFGGVRRAQRGALAGVLAAGLLVGAAFVPTGWTDSVATLWRVPRVPPVKIAQAQSQVEQAQKLLSSVAPTGPQDGAQGGPASGAFGATEELNRLSRALQEELSGGQESAERPAVERAGSALAQAAEDAAQQLERRAEDAAAAKDALRERLSQLQEARAERGELGGQSGDQSAGQLKSESGGQLEGDAGNPQRPSGERLARELGEALSNGDVDRARAAADRLAREAPGLSEADRRELGRELQKLADDIDRGAKPERTAKPAAAPRSAGSSSERKVEPKVEPPAEPPAGPTGGPTGEPAVAPAREGPVQERPAEERPNTAAKSDAEPPSSVGGQSDRTPERGPDRAPEQTPSARSNADREADDLSRALRESGRALEQPKPADQRAGEPPTGESPKREPPTGEPKSSAEAQPQQGQPQRGEPKSDGQQQGEPPPGGEGQPQQPGQPKSDGQQPQAEPRPGQPQNAPPQPSGESQQQQAQPQPGQPQPGQPQPGQSQPGGEGQQQQAQPQPGQSQPGQPQPGQPQPGQPQPGGEGQQQPKADGQQQQGEPAPGAPGPDPSLDQLREQLEKMGAAEGQRERQRQQDLQDSQQLREQAQRLWDNATPEERQRFADMAQRIAQERAEPQDQQRGEGRIADQKQPAQPQADAPERSAQSGASSQGPESPSQPQGFPRSGDDRTGRFGPRGATDPGELTDRGRSAGNEPGTDLTNPSSAAAPTREELIDARTKPRDDAPSRVIAEWLSKNPRSPDGARGATGSGQPFAGGPSAGQLDQAVQAAQRSAEQAIEQRVVPGRSSSLVRRYFERLPQALKGGSPSEVPTTTAPGTPAAPVAPATPSGAAP